jgi:hypothetical protein
MRLGQQGKACSIGGFHELHFDFFRPFPQLGYEFNHLLLPERRSFLLCLIP